MKNRRNKYLVESARITDAYLRMCAPKTVCEFYDKSKGSVDEVKESIQTDKNDGFFVIVYSDGKWAIESSWEYREDANDRVEEIKQDFDIGKGVKVVTKRGLKTFGLVNDNDSNWVIGDISKIFDRKKMKNESSDYYSLYGIPLMSEIVGCVANWCASNVDKYDEDDWRAFAFNGINGNSIKRELSRVLAENGYDGRSALMVAMDVVRNGLENGIFGGMKNSVEQWVDDIVRETIQEERDEEKEYMTNESSSSYEEDDDYDSLPSNEEIETEYKNFLGNREPLVETAEGVIYFQYDPQRNVFAYGGASNTGLLEDGTMEYDKTETMLTNLENLHDEIYDKYGYPEYDN